MTFEELSKEMIAAMKAGNKTKKSVLSTLVSNAKKVAIDKGCRDNITEEIVNDVILKELKTINEMVDGCPETRKDLLEEYNTKKVIVEEIAPKIISDKEGIKQFILNLGIEVDNKHRGEIMKNLKGKVDMKMANEVMKELI